jgi:glycerol kinase
MPVVLALDQGTTGTTALAVDEDQQVLARRTVDTPLEHPKKGWAQNPPEAILDACEEALAGVLERIDAGRVEALGITNQRETTLAWDADTGEALAPAVSWQCRRTEPLCRELAEREAARARIRERTGLVVDPYFSATKMRWLIDDEARVEAALAEDRLRMGTVDSFLLEHLTGHHRTDPSNASRTMLYNLHEADWDPELAELLDLPLDPLAEIRPSSGDFGQISPDTRLGEALPELAGVPVAGVAGDQHASLFGHGCFTPGESKGTMGTGAFFLVNTGDEVLIPEGGVVATVAWDLGQGPEYALEGSAFACGSALEWASEAGWLNDPTTLDEQADSVDDADGAAFVPAFYGLGAPFWDADAQAGLVGLSSSTDRDHIARAVAEGLTAQNALLLDALAEAGQPIDHIRLDGGVSRSDVLCQLLADATDQRVLRTEESDLTAMGAAGLAGLEVGVWTRKQLAGGPTETFTPRDEAVFIDRYKQAAAAIGELQLD